MQEEPKENEKFTMDPTLTASEKSLTKEELRERGKLLVSQKKWHEAFRVYTALLTHKEAKEDDYAIGLSNRSFTLYNLNKFEEAKNDGLRCLKLRPKWVKGYLRTAQAFLAMNDISKAVAYFKGGIGKEGDDGSMVKKVNELFLEMNSPNRILKTNYYYPELKEFKENFFSNPDKANEIVMKLYEKKGKVYNHNELEKVLEEINQIVSKTWHFNNVGEIFEKENKFFAANCCYKMETVVQNNENKDRMREKIMKNLEKEESTNKEGLIESLATSRPLQYKHSIDLRKIIDLYQKYIIDNYYFSDKHGNIFYNYFLDDVKEAETLWMMSPNFSKSSTVETFSAVGDKKKKIDYYWKYFMANAGAFINGAFATIIDNFTMQGIYPTFSYQNPETKQLEQVNVIYSATMDALVMRKFKNPVIYYQEKDGYFKLIKGKSLGKPFLLADCAHNLACLITDKLVFKKRLYLLVDFTATQFDLCEYNKNGYPYYEKTMLAGDHKVEKHFLVGSCAERIETHVEPMVREDKKFDYFPLKVWANVITDISKEVKKILGIYKEDSGKEEEKKEN